MKLLVMGDIHGKTEKLEKEISKHEFDLVIGVGDYAGIEEWRRYIKYIFSDKKKPKIGEGPNRRSPEEFYGKKKFKDLLKKDYEAGKRVLNFFNNLGKPGFFVFGNGDEEWYNFPFSKDLLNVNKRNLNFLKEIKNVQNLNYGIQRYGEITFLGFGGYLDVSANKKSRDKEWQKRVDQRMKKAEIKMNTFVNKIHGKSIFIFHYPPLGIFDIIKDKTNPYHGGSAGIDFFRKEILKKKPFLVLCGHMEEYQGKKKLGTSMVVNPGEGSKGKFAIVEINEKKGKVLKVDFFGKKD